MSQTTRKTAAPISGQSLDHTSLSAEDVANGNLNINVGTAPLRPAEFVPIEIQHLDEDAAATAPASSTPTSHKPPFATKKRNP
jgi:phage tail sheath protein FI